MSIWLKTHKADDYDMRFVFANTGSEHPDTLRFVNEIDKRYSLGVVWVEAVVHPGLKKACTHRIVTYESASRGNEPFEAVVSKYGLPNKTFGHCTRELKLNPIWSYLKSTGWRKGSYFTALGIRPDERRRVSKKAGAQKILYPLIDMVQTDKLDVLTYFEDFDWDLKIPEHQGNCIACYKKSDWKLHTLYREDPSNFDFVVKLDDLYKHIGPNPIPGPRRMFRGQRSARTLLTQFGRDDFDASRLFTDGGCSESCELFPMEEAAA